ncbi:hypothetical protein RCH09_002946 [Actimicrobium sp. GrIS 1.19]|uniref:transporter n=1 Tax=Actimicrobium sp. GrIS 1.19 TaxID=3071708 RepID=UPI002DFFB7D8|nr:hypothetical protein [Actimicrobium sp. GrIS 1.19]
MHVIRSAALCSALLLASSAASAAGDDAPITPYRPTVSNSAQLPSAGQLELELGLLASRDSSRRNSLPYLLKLAFNEQWGVLVGGEALVSQRNDSGATERGIGNTSLILKRAFLVSEGTAFGLELGASLPTARDVIGGGKTDATLNGILSQDLGAVHMDANLNFTRVGAIDPGAGRVQTGLSAAFSTALAERWNVSAELSGTRRPDVASTTQALVALAYSPSKRMTIDVGVSKGLRSGANDWAAFTGLVVPIAQLW